MTYSDDVCYATTNLVSLIGDEKNQFSNLKEQWQAAVTKFEVFKSDFEVSDLCEDVPDVQVQHKHGNMAKAYGEARKLEDEVQKLQQVLLNREVSIQALSGALLQICKQGISTVHNELAACPNGRLIGSSPVKEVIWQGRNQSLHFEEGNFRPPVVELFAHLEQDFGDQFSLERFPGKNMAADVVEVLGWRDYENFKADMRSMEL